MKCVNRNRRKPKKNAKRKNTPKVVRAPRKQTKNDTVDDIKHIEIRVSITSQSEEHGDRNDCKVNSPMKNKCGRNHRSACQASGKLEFDLKETSENKGESNLMSEFITKTSIQQTVSI